MFYSIPLFIKPSKEYKCDKNVIDKLNMGRGYA